MSEADRYVEKRNVGPYRKRPTAAEQTKTLKASLCASAQNFNHRPISAADFDGASSGQSGSEPCVLRFLILAHAPHVRSSAEAGPRYFAYSAACSSVSGGNSTESGSAETYAGFLSMTSSAFSFSGV